MESLFEKYQHTKVTDPKTLKVIKSDLALRNQLATMNSKLVVFVISKFYTKPRHKKLYEDILQEGHLGLLSAIDGYKPELGYKFSTYAAWWIRQRISLFLLNKEPTITIPPHIRTIKNKLMNLAVSSNKMFSDLTEEDAATLGFNKNKFIAANSAANVVVPSFIPLFSEPCIGEEWRKTAPEKQEEEADSGTVVKAAQKAFDRLPLRQRLILVERFKLWQSTMKEEDENADH